MGLAVAVAVAALAATVLLVQPRPMCALAAVAVAVQVAAAAVTMVKSAAMEAASMAVPHSFPAAQLVFGVTQVVVAGMALRVQWGPRER